MLVSVHMGYKKLWPGILTWATSQVLACKYATTNLFFCSHEPQASYMIHKMNMLVLQDFYRSFTRACTFSKIFTGVSQRACTFSTKFLQEFHKPVHFLQEDKQVLHKTCTRPPPLSPSLIVSLSFGNAQKESLLLM